MCNCHICQSCGAGIRGAEPGCGFRSLDPVPEPGREVPELGSAAPEHGPEVPEPGSGSPAAGSELPEPQPQTPDAGPWTPGPTAGQVGPGGIRESLTIKVVFICNLVTFQPA